MNQERDRFLTEAMGECWHELIWIERSKRTEGGKKKIDNRYECNKCKERHAINSDFSTWEGFGKLWEWAIKQEWWSKFLRINGATTDTLSLMFADVNIINPDRFSNAIYNFLKEKEIK